MDTLLCKVCRIREVTKSGELGKLLTKIILCEKVGQSTQMP